MLEVPLDGLHVPAQRRADAVPHLRRSMRGARGNEVGAMGELVAGRYLAAAGIGFVEDSTIDHDLLVAGLTVDVKTKERTVAPLPHYECTVADYNHAVQQPDAYLFVSLLGGPGEGCGRFTRGWILGSMLRTTFEREASSWTPAMVDLDNGWRPTIPCRNVRVEQLSPPKANVGAAGTPLPRRDPGR